MRGRGHPHPQPHSIGFDSTSAIPNSFLPHPSLGSNISNISNAVQSSLTFVKTQFENSQLRCDSIDATPDDAEIKLFGNSSPRSGDLQHCTCNLESSPSLQCSIELCFSPTAIVLLLSWLLHGCCCFAESITAIWMCPARQSARKRSSGEFPQDNGLFCALFFCSHSYSVEIILKRASFFRCSLASFSCKV